MAAAVRMRTRTGRKVRKTAVAGVPLTARCGKGTRDGKSCRVLRSGCGASVDYDELWARRAGFIQDSSGVAVLGRNPRMNSGGRVFEGD